MQVLEHTDSVLRLCDRPPRSLWLAGSILVLTGTVIPFASGHHELACQRQAPPLT